jgi:hypothetical protein
MKIQPKPSVYHLRFSELGISSDDIEILMGYETGKSPEPILQCVHEVLAFAEKLGNISGACIVYDNITVDPAKMTLTAGGIVFSTGKIVTRQLQKAASAAVFVCTAGEDLELLSKQQMKVGHWPEGYIADLAGSVIVEAAMDRIQQSLSREMSEAGTGISNRYSPGYCQWPVEEQQKLFQLIPEGLCGVVVTPSSFMHPVKSVSGLIGIGKNVKAHPYTCEICDINECIYRNLKRH